MFPAKKPDEKRYSIKPVVAAFRKKKHPEPDADEKRGPRDMDSDDRC